ncbi:hypothetical protein EIN_267930 [Entamoeba invadens IP1]|uniref:Spatacsin C-terminal domain-containing protein n=1 Tax=Entamoeba invadens IP1 TaxID=370355 RepID=A0A0A1UBK6_ENTIV|nr:hypothetical protein EIN_267930 [Entamoeba invadens IP1]ELP91057.1 hypothetical protein EIN_267930 [Entamoeba invadens IP1]|eukprot:XP_004257828.1 hypothetical protein EIN_267930 [Entamoeba invadens IP1]
MSALSPTPKQILLDAITRLQYSSTPEQVLSYETLLHSSWIIPTILSLFSDPLAPQLHLQLSILLKRVVVMRYNDLDSQNQLLIIDSIFPLICASRDFSMRNQFGEVVKFIYTKDFYPQNVQWLFENISSQTEGVIQCFAFVFRANRNVLVKPENVMYNIFLSLSNVFFSIVEKISETNNLWNAKIVENVISILADVTTCGVPEKLMQQVGKWLYKTTDLIQLNIGEKSTKYLFRFLNNIFQLNTLILEKCYSSFFHINVKMLLNYGFLLLTKTTSPKIEFLIEMFVWCCLDFEWIYSFVLLDLERVLLCVIPKLRLSEEDVTLLLSNPVLFLHREEDKKYETVSGFSAGKKLVKKLCQTFDGCKSVFLCVIRFLTQDSCRHFYILEGCVVTLVSISNNIKRKFESSIENVIQIAVTLMKSQNRVEIYYGLVLLKEFSSNVFQSLSTLTFEKLQTHRLYFVIQMLFAFIENNDYVQTYYAVLCLKNLITNLPERIVKILLTKVITLLRYPSYDIINLMMQIFSNFPNLRPLCPEVLSQASKCCYELCTFYSSLDGTDEDTKHMKEETVDLVTQIFQALYCLQAYAPTNTSIFALLSEILKNQLPITQRITHSISSVVGTIGELQAQNCNNFELLERQLELYLTNANIEESAGLIPALSTLVSICPSVVNRMFINEFLTNEVFVMYEDDYVLADLTFLAKMCVIHNVIRPSDAVEPFLAVFEKCEECSKEKILTTIFTAFLVGGQELLLFFEENRTTNFFLKNVMEFETGGNFYITKIHFLALSVGLAFTNYFEPDKVVKILLKEMALLQKLRGANNQLFLAMEDGLIDESSSEGKGEEIAEERCKEILNINEMDVFIKNLRNVANGGLLKGITQEEEHIVVISFQMREIIISTFPFLEKYKYTTLKLSQNQTFFALGDETTVTILSIDEKMKHCIENVMSFNWATLNNSETLVYQQGKFLYLFDVVTQKSFVLQDLPSSKKVSIDSYLDSFIVISPLESLNTYDVNVYDSSLRLFNYTLNDVNTFTTQHQLTLFLHFDYTVTIISPKDPHKLSATLPFLKVQMPDVQSFSFGEKLSSYIFSNGKCLLSFKPITTVIDSPYKELLLMDTMNKMLFETVELPLNKAFSTHIFVSQTGVFVLQSDSTTFELSKIGGDEKITQKNIQMVYGTVFPLYFTGQKLVVAVPNDSRRMLLTLINGGFSELIGDITRLNPQFAVDSADSRVLITLEHALETDDLNEVDKTVKILLEKEDLQLLVEALKIFEENMVLETSYESIQACLKIVTKVAKRELMQNKDILSRVILKIGELEKERSTIERNKLRNSKSETVKCLNEVEQTLKLVKVEELIHPEKFDDLILHGNISSAEKRDKDIMMKGQGLILSKAVKGDFDNAIRISLRLGVVEFSLMLLRIILNTTNSHLREGCIHIYKELEYPKFEFDEEFIKTYDAQDHTNNKEEKYDEFLPSKIEEIHEFEGDVSKSVSERFHIAEVIQNVKKEHVVIRVNDTLSADKCEKTMILIESGELRQQISVNDAMKYFISHNEYQKAIRWIEEYKLQFSGTQEIWGLWRIVQYYAVNPTRRLLEEYLMSHSMVPDEAYLKYTKCQITHPMKSADEKKQSEALEEYKKIQFLPLIDSAIENFKIQKYPIMWMNQIKALHANIEDAILMNTLKFLDAPIPLDLNIQSIVFGMLTSKPLLAKILKAFFNREEKVKKVEECNGVLTSSNGDITLPQFYSGSFQVVYDPYLTKPLGFVPRKCVPQTRNVLDAKYYLLEKECVRALLTTPELTIEEMCNVVITSQNDVRTTCVFYLNDPYLRLVIVLHEDLSNKYGLIFNKYPSLKAIQKGKELDYAKLLNGSAEIKLEFMKCYEEVFGNAYPSPVEFDRIGFLRNYFKLPQSTLQLQVLARNQAFIETIVYSDKHGFDWSVVKDIIVQYSGDSAIAKHVASILGALSKNSGDRGLLTMLLEYTPLEALAVFIESSNKTIESVTNRILEMVNMDISCHMLCIALSLFDSKNAIRHFFDVCWNISQTYFEKAEESAKQMKMSEGLIGDEEWRKKMIETVLDIEVEYFQIHSPMRLQKLIESLEGQDLGQRVELKIKKFCSIIRIIEVTQVNLKLTEDSSEFIEKMSHAKCFKEAYDHIIVFDPIKIFGVIEKEADQMVEKKVSWEGINEFLEAKKSPALDVTKYFQSKIDKISALKNEKSFKEINKEVVGLLLFKEKWFEKLERENPNGIVLQLHAENKQMLMTYQQAMRESVPVEALINPTEESVYYVLSTSNYTLAQQMDETVHTEEIPIFTQVLHFVSSQESYQKELESGLKHIDELSINSKHITTAVELLKIRFEMIYKYFDDKSLVLVVLSSSADYNSKVFDFLQTIISSKVLSKLATNTLKWAKVFQDARRFVDAEHIDQKELGKFLASNFVEVTDNVRSCNVMGWSTPNMLNYLNILKDQSDIVLPLLQLTENIPKTNTLCEALILCHTAAKNTNSALLMEKVLGKIKTSLVVFLIPHNHAYLVRVITRTKAYEDVQIKEVNNPPTTLVRYFVKKALTDSEVDYSVLLQTNDQKDAFETGLYYQSDLAAVKDELGTSSPLYEKIFTDIYMFLNDSMEGGSMYFEKGNKILNEAINKMTTKRGSVEIVVSDLNEALECYLKAVVFFCNGQEYYRANKCARQINLIALQMFYNNVQLLGLSNDKAKIQLQYFWFAEDAQLYADAYDLAEAKNFIPALFEQCVVKGNLKYLEEWRSYYEMDKRLWNDVMEYVEKPQKVIKKKEIEERKKAFITAATMYWPTLFCENGVAIKQMIIVPEMKELIRNAGVARIIEIDPIIALDD